MSSQKIPFPSRVKGCLRLTCFFLLCIPSFRIQPPFLMFLDQKTVCRIPRFWHWCVCKIMGIKVVVKGTPASHGPTFFVSNHLSYLDIPVIGQTLTTYFIAKKEVETWPLFGWLSKLQKTLFIKRNTDGLEKAASDITRHIEQNHSLTIFPEGTSSDGQRVLPFKSSLFAVFFNKGKPETNVEIQPFTIRLAEIDGKAPQSEEDYNIYAWHGEMELPPHLWTFACSKGAVIELVFHPSFGISPEDTRKTLCLKSYEMVKSGLEKS